MQQAAKLDVLAEQAADSATRTGYRELAQRFRDMANLPGVSQMPSDVEIIRLAERMVGKARPA
ncbi:MAG TPA: hypothetical protein VFK79_13785 [Xanthobacteraceae bacterium]|nr:hypothetical protein [Xanthobacteraceae bacterium]